MQEIKCRWSPTLGDLEGTAEETWGTTPYNPETDRELPCVFFGIYGLPDFYTLWRHKGRRWILWAGSDILDLKNGYWLDGDGEIHLPYTDMARWINTYCENWCENTREQAVLLSMGIEAQVCPSFLGDVNQFQLSYKPGNKVYASVSGDNFNLYGWYEIEQLAPKHPDIEFHLYGNVAEWKTENPNVFVHGRIPKEQMNAEIKEMQGGLRMLNFDGFSEILAKSVLWGQWPISLIKYPHMLSVEELGTLPSRTGPNVEGRDYYLKTLNNFTWNLKK